jgi:MtrB/PioB family decaheme-associated outer membrane protein
MKIDNQRAGTMALSLERTPEVFPSRLTLLTACVAAAVAQFGISQARADSGAGVDTSLGNAFNPAGFNTLRPKDPDGLGESADSRTPTGLRTAEPFLIKEPRQTASGWLYNGFLEFGLLGGDATNEKAAKFREYRNVDTNFYLSSFGLQANKPDSAAFVEVTGGGAGQDDQYYGVSFGRYNDWRVKAFYNETPHVFSTTYRSLWSGVGTGNLTLNGLRPGGTAIGNNVANSQLATANNVRNAVAATSDSELSIVRKKGGARLDMNLLDNWKFYASYTNEKREGARPFGTVLGGGGGGGNFESAESIDYTTHDLMAGVQFADTLNSLNVGVAASLFRNNIGTLTIQNPLYAGLTGITGLPATTFTQARYDLYPDNDYFNLKGEYARRLPDLMNGRFTALASISKLKQNDNLIAPTPFALTGGTINTVSTANVWNTTAALTKQSADAEIDTRLLDLGLSLTPVNGLDVRGKVRYYETQNKTEYWACNPLTGQWGRLINEGSGSALVNTNYRAGGCDYAATQALGIAPSAGNINIRNIPFEYKQMNYTLAADYRLNRGNSLNASYERKIYDREHRERDETREDKLKLGWVNRGFEQGTVRLSFEHDRRRGSEYKADPYEEFYSASLGPLPAAANTSMAAWLHNIEQFRKYDLADRDQNIFNGRLNYMLAQGLDAGVSLQWKDVRYPDSEYGRNDRQKQHSLNFDLSWQPTDKLNLFGYYSYQQASMHQKSIQPNACAIGVPYYFWSNGQVTTTAGAPVAGVTRIGGPLVVTAGNFLSVCGTAAALSPLYPTSRAWEVTQKDRHDVLGLGLKYDFGKARLDMNYTYARGRTKVSYDYNAAALGITNSANIAVIGSGWPDLTFSQHAVETNLLIPVSKTVTVRLLHRYESGRISDWHYDGVAANPVPSTAGAAAVYLDSGPQRYKATLLGALLMLDF